MRTPADLPNTDAPTSEYPYGRLRNDIIPKDGTGTPVRQDWLQDMYYALLKIIVAGGLTPNGAAETVLNSQVWQAMCNVFPLKSSILSAPYTVRGLLAGGEDNTTANLTPDNIKTILAQGTDTTVVTNFNADKLDGHDSSYFLNTSGIIPDSCMPNLTGDVTTTEGAVATTISARVVTNAKMASMADSTIKGRAVGAGAGDPTDLTAAQAAAIIKSANVLSTSEYHSSSGSGRTYTIGSMAVGETKTININMGNSTGGAVNMVLASPASGTYAIDLRIQILTGTVIAVAGSVLHFNGVNIAAGNLYTQSTGSGIYAQYSGTITRQS